MDFDLLIRNARLHDAPEGARPVDIAVADGKIEAVDATILGERFADVLDAGGLTAVPGFIDVHVHGAGGRDSTEGTEEAVRTISETLARFGTTGFLATTFAQPKRRHRHFETLAACSEMSLPGARLLGVHIEGPFVNFKRRGGIPPDTIYECTQDAADDLLRHAHGALRIVTLAPELPGVLPFIGRLVENGIVASFGHSDADYRQTREGIEAGISHVTHIYNVMPGLHHRDPGPLLAVFESDHVSAEIIADGVHVHPRIVRWTAGVLGHDRLMCVTDGMQGTGLPEGQYVFNGREYESKDGTARYLDGTLIGTTLGLGRILKRFIEYTGLGLPDAIKTVTEVPARLLGLDHRKGRIETGMDADIVLLDENLSVAATVVEGRVAYAGGSLAFGSFAGHPSTERR